MLSWSAGLRTGPRTPITTNRLTAPAATLTGVGVHQPENAVTGPTEGGVSDELFYRWLTTVVPTGAQ